MLIVNVILCTLRSIRVQCHPPATGEADGTSSSDSLYYLLDCTGLQAEYPFHQTDEARRDYRRKFDVLETCHRMDQYVAMACIGGGDAEHQTSS